MVCYKHGMTLTPTYSFWRSMKTRCDKVGHKYFSEYGGRGISYCERWDDFLLFFEDMGERPMDAFLDRKNNDENYSKDNCKWSFKGESNFNKRTKGILPRGVSFNCGRYQAKMKIEKITYLIGSFDTKEMAGQAYLKMCLEWYGKLPPEKK